MRDEGVGRGAALMKALIVSHETTSQQFLEDLLQAAGLGVTACADAESAWAAWERDRPSLVLVDLLLPNQAGLRLCRELARPAEARGCLILAIAAGSRVEDLEAALDAGADDYLHRPLDGRLLKVRLAVARRQVQTLGDRARAQQALRESELKYRTLFESALDAAFLETLGGRVLEANAAACEMYGYTREEFLTKSVFDLVPEDVARELAGVVSEEVGAGGFFRRTRNKRKSGEVFPCAVSARILEFGGRPLALVHVRDLSASPGAEPTA